MNRIFIFIYFSFTLSMVFSQKEEDVAEMVTTAKREVEQTIRITNTPSIIDTTIVYKIIEYPLLDIKYATKITLEPIQAANIRLNDSKLVKLYHGYIKAGLGSYIMPLGELYYNNTRSRKYSFGINLKHISAFGDLSRKEVPSLKLPTEFINSSFSAFGGITQLTYALKGNAYFSNYAINRYGSNSNVSIIKSDLIEQRYKEAGASVEFLSSKMDSLKLNYLLNLSVYNRNDNKDNLLNYWGNENNIASHNSFWYRKGKEMFASDVSVQYNSFRSDTLLSNTIFTLKPSITTFAKSNRLKAQIGMDINAVFAEKTSFAIYPIAELKCAFFDNLFIPYLGLTGGLKQQTFKSLSTQNPFIQSNPDLKNESTPYKLFLGIRGILSKHMEFNFVTHFSEIRNKALFISDSSKAFKSRNQFLVIYDTLKVFSAEASLSYQLVEKLKLDGIVRFFNYELNNNARAWNLPQYQIIFRGNYAVNDKLKLNLDFNGEGGRKSLIVDSTAGVKKEDNQYVKELGFILDINLGIEYKYTKRISAFLQFNNIASQQYYRWSDYPVLGLQVMGGVTFKF